MPVTRKGQWNNEQLTSAIGAIGELYNAATTKDPFIASCQTLSDRYLLATCKMLGEWDALNSDAFNRHEHALLEEYAREIFEQPFADAGMLKQMITADGERFRKTEYYTALRKAGLVRPDGGIDLIQYAARHRTIQREFIQRVEGAGMDPSDQIALCDRLLKYGALTAQMEKVADVMQTHMEPQKVLAPVAEASAPTAKK